MKTSSLCSLSVLISLLSSANLFSQEIPNDPNSLPKMIGGQNSNNSRIDTMTVAGKVTLDGLPQGQPRPRIFVVVYSLGRLVVRRPVAENGSYSINEVPREGATLVVEIDQTEVASNQIISSPARIVYQDFTVSVTPLDAARSKAKVIDAAAIYERSRENQDRFERAIADLRKGKTGPAVQLLKAIIDSDPRDFHAWTHLGNAYFLNKDYKDAEQAYLQAIAARPTGLPALVNLGKLYVMQNDFDKAIETLTKAVAAEPTSATAQQYLGEAYLGIKKGSIAVGYLNEAIRLAPIEMAEVHLRLGALYNGAGLKPRAAAEYQKFLAKVPNYERSAELKKYIAENPPDQ